MANNPAIPEAPPLIVIAGPTASGKSSMALQMAAGLNGEIISVDSMQLYRIIPIGTAQPTMQERQLVPHHLVGIYELEQRSEVYTFVEMAERCIADICRRGKQPILCGGTGLYLKALLYGLDPLPGDDKLKKELDTQYDSVDMLEELQQRLIQLGDAAVVNKFTNNRRRLIRALEIRLMTGRSILDLQQEYQLRLRFSLDRAVYLVHDRSVLQQRIALRTSEMLKNGWIDEARNAIKCGLLESPTAHQALGYKIIKRYLDGEITLDKLQELIVTATWQYARRQQTWFRHQHPELTALALS
ncbi:MAG: tRNA (adenosine(37)-N6)-dimethylallyltransferase MiaA [Lentisphaerae bacterium]|nr:tRNA (adenosine(37)-N6)-dimethylallyltransferase MiaA [Lentisphaerota bacterium]